MESFIVQGFKTQRRVKSEVYHNSHNLENMFIGYNLDEIQITATINSTKSIDNMIKFLQQSRPCFE